MQKITEICLPLDPLIITEILLNIQETIPNNFQKLLFWISQIYGCPFVWHFWKRRAPRNDEDPSDQFLKISDMGPISTRKHEWNVGNILPISSRKHDMEFGNLGSIKKTWRSMFGKVGKPVGRQKLRMIIWRVQNNWC